MDHLPDRPSFGKLYRNAVQGTGKAVTGSSNASAYIKKWAQNIAAVQSSMPEATKAF